MKKILALCVAFTTTLCVMAQNNSKQTEVGLVFSNLYSYGLSLKKGNQNALWRLNTINLSSRETNYVADSIAEHDKSKGYGISIGKEYRKNIYDNLDFRIGADLGFSYNYSIDERNDKTVDNEDVIRETTTYGPKVNMVLGICYNINDNFIVGAEVQPNIRYVSGERSETRYYQNDGEPVISDISGFDYGISNSGVLLSIAYAF